LFDKHQLQRNYTKAHDEYLNNKLAADPRVNIIKAPENRFIDKRVFESQPNDLLRKNSLSDN
jgi:hypothetical protein